MSHSVRRKCAVKSIAAIRAACAAWGIVERAPTVIGNQIKEEGYTIDGDRVTVVSKKFTGAYSFERPVPVVFDTKEGTCDYDHDFSAKVSEFLAQIMAAQIKAKARAEGHQVQAREVLVKGRRVLRLTVEG